MNTMRVNFSTMLSLAMLAAAALLVGCQNSGPSSEDFFPTDETASAQRLFDQQAANGACEDATLYPEHFTAGKLNSLGQDKLDRMMHSEDACVPQTIFMAGPKDDKSMASRKESVTAFLKNRGVADEQIRLQEGTNPGNTFMARDGITALTKMESASASEGGDATMGSSAGSAAAPSAGSTSGTK